MTTLFDHVGGEKWFRDLVERFYDGVGEDPLLRPLYPEADLGGAKARLAGFLVQYWGGPDDYSRVRGHPRLRMRHNPYGIGQVERDRWLFHMTNALRGCEGLDAEAETAVMEYFERASTAMINRYESGPDGGNT